MCSSHQPEAGADSGVLPVLNILPGGRSEWVYEPEQVQCGLWVERSEVEQGFCALAPDHDGRCQPVTEVV